MLFIAKFVREEFFSHLKLDSSLHGSDLLERLQPVSFFILRETIIPKKRVWWKIIATWYVQYFAFLNRLFYNDVSRDLQLSPSLIVEVGALIEM